MATVKAGMVFPHQSQVQPLLALAVAVVVIHP
jgi:hypothetical protein